MINLTLIYAVGLLIQMELKVHLTQNILDLLHNEGYQLLHSSEYQSNNHFEHTYNFLRQSHYYFRHQRSQDYLKD